MHRLLGAIAVVAAVVVGGYFGFARWSSEDGPLRRVEEHVAASKTGVLGFVDLAELRRWPSLPENAHVWFPLGDDTLDHALARCAVDWRGLASFVVQARVPTDEGFAGVVTLISGISGEPLTTCFEQTLGGRARQVSGTSAYDLDLVDPEDCEAFARRTVAWDGSTLISAEPHLFDRVMGGEAARLLPAKEEALRTWRELRRDSLLAVGALDVVGLLEELGGYSQSNGRTTIHRRVHGRISELDLVFGSTLRAQFFPFEIRTPAADEPEAFDELAAQLAGQQTSSPVAEGSLDLKPGEVSAGPFGLRLSGLSTVFGVQPELTVRTRPGNATSGQLNALEIEVLGIVLQDGTEVSAATPSGEGSLHLPPGVQKPVSRQNLVFRSSGDPDELTASGQFTLGLGGEKESIAGLRVRLRHRQPEAVSVLPLGTPTSGKRVESEEFALRVASVDAYEVHVVLEKGASQLLGAYRAPQLAVDTEGPVVLDHGETLALCTGREGLALAVATSMAPHVYEAYVRRTVQ